MAGTLINPQALIFFLIPLFQNLELKVVPLPQMQEICSSNPAVLKFVIGLFTRTRALDLFKAF